MAGLNEFAISMLVSGSSGMTAFPIDFGGRVNHVRIYMDSTGFTFGYSFKSTGISQANTAGVTMRALDTPHSYDFLQYITGMSVFPLTTATSTAAGGAASIRIHAWG